MVGNGRQYVRECSRFVLFISPSHNHSIFSILRGKYDAIRHFQRQFFLHGQLLWQKFWRWKTKLGVIILDWCCMWKKSGEIVDHLVLRCEIASALWAEVLSRVYLAWVMPASMVELLACWSHLGSIKQITTVWKMVPICILWCIW